jgi:FkbM family methyltransferase
LQAMKDILLYFSNLFYKRCFPIYRPIYFFYKRVSERHEYSLLRRLIKPGGIVVDVGANVGAYTRFLGHLVGKNGYVHAFEPEETNFARLRENVDGLTNIKTIHSAVGDRPGRIKLYVSKNLNVDHQTYDSGEGRYSIDVLQTTLDTYFHPGDRVDLIKIDVQGYEYRVLLGAQRVFRENPWLVVIMEYWPYGFSRAGFDPSSIIDLIQELGCSFVPIQTSGHLLSLSALDPQNPNHYCDLIVSRNLHLLV